MDTSGTITVLYVNADESASTLTPEDEQFDVAVAANADEPVEQSSGGGVDCPVTSSTHDDWTIDLGESEDWEHGSRSLVSRPERCRAERHIGKTPNSHAGFCGSSRAVPDRQPSRYSRRNWST